MIILALDLSTKSSGYSVFDNNKLIAYGLAASTKANVYDRIEIITNKLE
jgi:Holliday junction resolvasome RuvABC endonuclease subunit